RLDQLGVHLGRASDDQPVVLPDPCQKLLPGPAGAVGHFDALGRPQRFHAFRRDAVADQHLHCHDFQTSRALPAPRPHATGAPSSARPISTAASVVTMSSGVAAPMWPMRKIFPFRSPCPPAKVTPVFLRTAFRSASGSTPPPVAAVSVGEAQRSSTNRVKPQARRPSRTMARISRCRSKRASFPSSSIIARLSSRAYISETADV